MYYLSLLILIPGTLLSLWAQNNIKSTYRRYAQVNSQMGMTGAEVAQTILNNMGIDDIRVEAIRGQLTDHYDPRAKTVRLSQGIYDSNSLAAAAVAAHECGHVLQDKNNYKFMNFRAALVPAANIGSQFGPMLVMLIFILPNVIILEMSLTFCKKWVFPTLLSPKEKNQFSIFIKERFLLYPYLRLK